MSTPLAETPTPIYTPLTVSLAPAPDLERTPDSIADNVQPVIDAVEALLPAAEVSKVKEFVQTYVKGEVAAVTVIAALVLQYVPIDSAVFHVATVILGVATVAGVVIARNLD